MWASQLAREMRLRADSRHHSTLAFPSPVIAVTNCSILTQQQFFVVSATDESALDGPQLAGAGRTGGTGRLRVWPCVAARSPLIPRYLCGR